MEQVMEKAVVRSFEHPDEVRVFNHGRLEIIRMAGTTLGRAIFEPGWRWSESFQPLISPVAPHFQYHISGIMVVEMGDGTRVECGPGDISLLPQGHDAWVVGDEPVVVVEFQGMLEFAMYGTEGDD